MNPAHLVLAPPRVARAIQEQLRSGQSLQQSYVFFVNTTQRTINLYWVNYKGHPTFYLTLRSKASAKVNTFVQHPWMFSDRQSGEWMHVTHSHIFWPQSYQEPNPKSGQIIQCRKQILIHFPVRSLRETCLWNIFLTLLDTKADQKISNNNEDSDSSEDENGGARDYNYIELKRDIDRLSLPYTIKSDLFRLLRFHAQHQNGFARNEFLR